MLPNRTSLLVVGVLILGVCSAPACGTSNSGSTPDSGGATPEGGNGSGQTDAAGGVTDSGAADATTDTGTAADTGAGSAADSGAGSTVDSSARSATDTGIADTGIGINLDAGKGGADSGPFPGCASWGAFTPVLVFDKWVASDWQPGGGIGLTSDSCVDGDAGRDPLRPWDNVTRSAGAVGKCYVQHIDLISQTTGWGAVGWLHYNAGDEGYPNHGERVANPSLLSICSATTVSFQAMTDTDGLVIGFAAGDPSYEATSGDITLKANVWTPVTMKFSGWVQVPVVRGFYWIVGYGQTALQGKSSFTFYLDNAKILP